MQQLSIYDTTLRDGLRNSGVAMTIDERIEVAVGLEAAGIHAIEVGYGGPDQPPVMQAIAGALTEAVVYGLSRVNLRDLDRVLEGVAPAPRSGANVYLPSSDDFLAAAGMTRDEGLLRLARAVEHARLHVDHVVFATQDASRADRAYLTDLCTAAIGSGATTISVSDTVSHALPAEFADLCAALREIPGGEQVRWSVHCHDELGLALANTLAALAAGVDQFEGTVNGIGEGAGNTSIAGVLTALRARPEAFAGHEVAVDGARLHAVAGLVSAIARAANSGPDA